MRKFRKIGEITLEGCGPVLVHAGRYACGGQIAITLSDARTFEPVATLSTNAVVGGAAIAQDAFAVKSWSENEPLIAPLLASGLFEDTGSRFTAGYAQAPIWRLRDPAHIPSLQRRREQERSTR